MMTWLELLGFLSKMEGDRLHDTATVYDVAQGEYYPCDFLEIQEGDDVLDDGHIFLAIKQDED